MVKKDVKVYNVEQQQLGPANNDKDTKAQAKQADQEQQPVKRAEWTGKFDFFFSSLGYAVGLGNVWRFPYLAYKNGGGAFVIPYIVCMLFLGIPLVFLEMYVGQFTSQGLLSCWTAVPLFRGIGISNNVVTFFLNIYYNMIIAYALYYFVMSFRTTLPWQKCDPEWSTASCVDDYSEQGSFVYNACEGEGMLKCANDGKCYNATAVNGRPASCYYDSSMLNQIGWHKPTFPTQDYWDNVILKQSSGIEETGSIDFALVGSLLAAWFLVWLVVIGGIKVSGKLVHFMALFPYVLLLGLGIRGWSLPGAGKGIEFYMNTDFAKLLNVQVWIDAATQIFFSLSIGYGGLTALSSYNTYKNNIMRDAIAITLSNCGTSIFAGFVVFAYMGYLAEITGQQVDQVVQQGPGLAFIVYPFAVTTIPGAPVWAIMFFAMLVFLGLDTMQASAEATITSLADVVPYFRRTVKRKQMLTTLICFMYFLLGLIFCFPSGTYWSSMFDTYSGDWNVLIVGAIEAISLSWFYGLANMRKDLTSMIGGKYVQNWTFYYWATCWCFITPCFITTLLVLKFKGGIIPINLNGYEYPEWTLLVGELFAASVFVGFFGWALYSVLEAFYKKKPLLSVIRPDFDKWKPKETESQQLRDEVHGFQFQTESFQVTNIVQEEKEKQQHEQQRPGANTNFENSDRF